MRSFRWLIVFWLLSILGCTELAVQKNYVNKNDFPFESPEGHQFYAQFCDSGKALNSKKILFNVINGGERSEWLNPVGLTSNGQPVYELSKIMSPSSLRVISVKTDLQRTAVYVPPYRVPVRAEDGWTDWKVASYTTTSGDPEYRIMYGIDMVKTEPVPGELKVRWRIGLAKELKDTKFAAKTALSSC